ncbi:hypothetical protein EPIR_3033 [Erwinia piriflorinigrans CFBP 5888]|uniref:Uncharacterized protein n=1 Tax=Erwinia piriflorinigrans CFBP 5888 TaxID=1161919 RepID=V5ZAJ4_9GAMM|nr:hypothetical protein EPIR_3033 [Erwinia piriflorinigrans CFBP 5888]
MGVKYDTPHRFKWLKSAPKKIKAFCDNNKC